MPRGYVEQVLYAVQVPYDWCTRHLKKPRAPLIRRLHWMHALRNLGAGLFATIFIINFIGERFETSSAGHEIKLATYQFLQRILDPIASVVVIVDISGFPPAADGTPRDGLTYLLQAIAKRHPKAIGVDIDLSPQDGRFVNGDIQLFNCCKKLCAQNIKVLLGVHRTIGLDRQFWLGLPEYKDLAAALLVPKNVVHYVRDLGTEDQQSIVSGLSKSVHEPSYSWLSYFCGYVTTKGEFEPHESLINYSNAETLQAQAIPVNTALVSRPGDASLQRLLTRQIKDGMIVLVGDMTNHFDMFPDPVLKDRLLPGVAVLGSGVYTAVQRPLCEVSEESSNKIDVELALVGVVIVSLFVLFLGDRFAVRGRSFTHAQVSAFVSRGCALLVIAIGLFVNETHVFWEGFILVAISLYVHPWADRTLCWLYNK